MQCAEQGNDAKVVLLGKDSLQSQGAKVGGLEVLAQVVILRWRSRVGEIKAKSVLYQLKSASTNVGIARKERNVLRSKNQARVKSCPGRSIMSPEVVDQKDRLLYA